MGIKGYKVFNSDWTCRGFQYEVGKTYKHNGKINVCKEGFHFCEEAIECFNYYDFDIHNKVAEVEAIGIVETKDNKSVTDEITILREIPWEEVLAIVNKGVNNLGKGNEGANNTGNFNIGNKNTGSCNTGNNNVGYNNMGSWNTGDSNTGNDNTGSNNIGVSNTGQYNIGVNNAGNVNLGDKNTGNFNIGNRNVGDWNKTDYAMGFFCNTSSKVRMFNKETDLTPEGIRNLEGIKVLENNFLEYYTIGNLEIAEFEVQGTHLKHCPAGKCTNLIDYTTCCQMMWDNLPEEDKDKVKALPNFDPDVFKDITGIDVTK